MATELGVAYLSLSASTKDFARDVKGALGDVESGAADTGKRSGSALGRGLSTGLKVVGGAVAGVTGLVAGLALKGGISRALAIEDAQAKLKGLGHDAESIQTIMDSALDSVRGTAFGLGDAAGVAATVVAAGVEPGEDLTRTLKLVADASTIAGTSMSDMGAIFNKVAGTGKIQGEVIAQLGERGIPILALLADELGVTAGEVSKLASEGKIDFETFQNAMEAGMGGAALASGDTFRGAMANTMAALGRLGEKVVGGVLPQIKDGFGDAIGVLDSWAPQAERIGEVLGQAISTAATWVRGTLIPALGEAVGWIRDELVPAVQSAAQWIRDNATWLGPLAAAIVGAVAAWRAYVAVMALWRAATAAGTAIQAAFNAVLSANPIGIVIVAIAALVAGLVWFFTQTETGRQIWATAWGAIQSAVQAVVSWWQTTVQPAFAAAWAAITEAATAAAAWYMTHVAPIFAAFGELVSAVVERIGSIVTWLWSNVVSPYLTMIGGLWSTIWAGVQAVWDKIGPTVMSGIATAITILQGIWSGVWNAIKALFEGVWNGIRIVAETVMGAIRGVITAVTAVIRGDWSGAWNAIKGVFTGIWDGMLSYVRNAIGTLTSVISGIKDTIMGVFRNAGTWLRDAGSRIIQGLADGIRNAVGKATDAIENVVGAVRDFLPFSPAKRGPFAGRGYSLYSGQALAGDFAKGMLSQRDKLGNAAGALMGAAALVPGRAGIPSGALAGGSSAAAPAFPSHMTLVDADGSILTRARVVASGVVASRERDMAGRSSTRGTAW